MVAPLVDPSHAAIGSIIIPVLNEGARIADQLGRLRAQLGPGWELIVVDGGSTDETCARAKPYCDRLLAAAAGRSLQMNAGAQAAKSELLVFLHADTDLPADFSQQMARFLASEYQWGRFDVRLDGRHFLFPWIARLMNLRSRLTGIATGDQTFFIRRSLFCQLGGFALIPLMEDIDFSVRAKACCPPYCSRSRVLTSARKWQRQGVLRTILLMWWIRLAYFLGVSPHTLHRWYYAR